MMSLRELRRIACWALITLMLGTLAPDAVAGSLRDHMSTLWSTATALSLTLITAVSANQK
jgi:hypothetical protein